ncbi:Polycomb protein suz12 [Cichlidogyrus casuarinus]|uniref:Polycomb protein suz12 n=1 Tax=Cichlidogyrus casuarinus TaxID=1844966 RepID=A0ABD2Q8L3_9PLAT
MEWLRQHYQRKLEEFTDVNAGEKKMMQLWNAYLLGITPDKFVVSDGLIGTVIMPGFVEKYGPYIAKQGLRFNLLLHLTNLVEYGLLSSKRLRICMDQFDRLAACK